MVQITSFVVATTTLMATQALALSCVPGRFYCGYALRSDSDQAAWTVKIDLALDAAQKPRDGNWQNNSLFQCRDNNQIVWDDFCPGNGLTCATPQNNICANGNYCCA